MVWILVQRDARVLDVGPEYPYARHLRNLSEKGGVCLMLSFGTVAGETARQVSVSMGGGVPGKVRGAFQAGHRNPKTSSFRTAAASPTSHKKTGLPDHCTARIPGRGPQLLFREMSLNDPESPTDLVADLEQAREKAAKDNR
ncbi:hypothetical protein SAMN05428954_6650 [Streptomyces sp. 2112.3]|nr:hypothetical protein SAMN05428954_6650 [Streptomyces sp. 2112.3]